MGGGPQSVGPSPAAAASPRRNAHPAARRPDLLNQNLWGRSPVTMVLTSPPGDSDAESNLRVTRTGTLVQRLE